ncbi:unnamed protein product, partial [Polarella glacialis]
AICAFLADGGFKVLRTYWHQNVCYMRLGDEDQAKRLTYSHGGLNSLELMGEVMKVRIARSTRRLADRGKVHEDLGTQETDAADPAAPSEVPSECPLCGVASHVLRQCPARSRGLRVSCAAFEQTPRQEAEAEVAKASAECASFEAVRWHGSSLYIIMPTAADASQLVQLAAGEGMEIAGEMASVELAASLERHASTFLGRVKGLRPEAPGRAPGGKARGKAKAKHRSGKSKGGLPSNGPAA